MGDRSNITKFDRLVGEKTERPFGIALGRFSACQGNDVNFDFSCDFGFDRGRFPFLSPQGSAEPMLAVAGSNFLDGRGGCVEGNGRLLNGHGLLPVLVHGKQNVRSHDGSRRHPAGTYNLGELFALRRRQTHLVLLYRHNRIVLSIAQQRYN